MPEPDRRYLSHHPPRSPAEVLGELAQWCADHDVGADMYGHGAGIEAFESRVADMLGFEAARFMPSGTMAQLIALRVWAERAGTRHVGMHPTSHLELHEQRGYAHLHGLNATLIGPRDEPMAASHLQAVPERLAAVVCELPIREAGGLLPTWDQLEALKQAAAERQLPLHLDGARLWSCGPAYGRPYDTICAGFSSVYVSFYKSIGALPGAMLCGDSELIAQAVVWQRRHGGNLYTQAANVASAEMRLDPTLAQMPTWLVHARAIASAIGEVSGVRVLPTVPHTHMFHIVVDLAPADASAARTRVAKDHGLWLFGGCRPGPLPGTARVELSVMQAGLSITPAEAAAGFAALFEAPERETPAP